MAMGTGNKCFETHLIKEDGTLNVGEFDDFLKKVNLAACGLKYAVVSIMGPQSSGKSTLLNHLFGSKFTELDGENQIRGKTTKGIWMARCVGIEPCTLLMDVEGSDGRERGEDDTSFERQSGLFAFAVSHIVLINMFAHSVGLEQGASKPLLKHVFQGVLRLPTSPRKTTLMFVIRDIIRTTPLKELDPILRKDINKIWDSIPKPDHHKRTPLSTFFNIEIEGLPNYVERGKEFEEQVNHLRGRFNQYSIAPGGLPGDSREKILGSDFSLWAQRIWETIKKDKILDLPTEMEMLANTRCGEIADKKFNAFKEKEEWRLEESAKTNPAPGFGKDCSKIIKSCLEGYDKETALYDDGVRSKKRKYLEEKVISLVQLALRSILVQIRSRTFVEFKEAYLNALEERKDVKVAADNCKEACMKSFDDRCADVIVEQVNCNTKGEREILELGINNVVLHAEKLRQRKQWTEILNALRKGLGGAVLSILGTIGLADTGSVAERFTDLWTAVGNFLKAFNPENRKISRSELEAELKALSPSIMESRSG